MDIFTKLYLDVKSLGSHSKKKQLKRKQKKYKEICKVESNEKIVSLNLNKNKNWELKSKLIFRINQDFEFGNIDTNKKLKISIFEPGTNKVIQTFTYSKEILPNRNDRTNFRYEKKFGTIMLKKEVKHLRKILKNKSKRKIVLSEDVSMITEKLSKNFEFSIKPIWGNLEKLIDSVDQSGPKFKTFEDPICCHSKPSSVIQKQYNCSFRQAMSDSECLICLDHTKLKLILNSCNHGCCERCWKSYVKSKFSFENLTCYFFNCKTKLETDLAKYLLPGNEFYKILNKEIECRRKCGSFFNLNCGLKFPRCVCGYSFCTECYSESHFPIECDSYQFYLTTMQERIDSTNELIFMGKFCPSCKMFIEKSGGCQHMTCSCGNEFCWNCLKKYSPTHSNCSTIEEFTFGVEDLDKPSSTTLIERYNYKALIEKILISNLKKEADFLKKISRNVDFKLWSAKIIQNFKIEPRSCKFFIYKIIKFSFDLIEKANRSIELLFGEEIFYKSNHVKLNDEKVSNRKLLINLCKGLNRILLMDNTTFSKIIPLIYQIFLVLKKLKSIHDT